MGNLFKFLILVTSILAVLLIPTIQTSAAETDTVKTKCDYNSEANENPDKSTLNCLLTEMALAYDVPPEIVKAVAEEETAWKHFDANGEVIVSDDNGIGIMQITNQEDYDETQLREEIVYNIQAGVKILDYMFGRSDLPSINSMDRNVLENWYFAVMAYNGTKPVNSPIKQDSGERNTDAYQERVYQNIIDYGLLTELEQLPFSSDDFSYDSESDENIEFVTMNYHFNLPLTKTKHKFQDGDKASLTTNTKFRPRPDTDSTFEWIPEGEIVTIEGQLVYEQNPAPDSKNQFVWYKIKRSNGSVGYVASSYLKFWFKDLPADHYFVDEIYYLSDRGIINGIPNGEFGLETSLTRWQVVLMVVRAKNISLDDRPDPGFSDVPNSHKYYNEIAAVVDEGYFEGKSDSNFDPNGSFTRREMAVVLQNLYDFPNASSDNPFKDVQEDSNSWWYEDAVASLYQAGITHGTSTGDELQFKPFMEVSRGQFAAFMARSMNEDFRVN